MIYVRCLAVVTFVSLRETIIIFYVETLVSSSLEEAAR